MKSANEPRRAILSVSDKAGIIELARGLAKLGFELYSTGGTRKHLEQAGVSVVDIADYTQFPEIMHGRVKTLHPKIFGGILCRRDEASDRQAIQALDIRLFDVVVVNLYPFAETISRSDVRLEEAIENIDIGGPSLIRAAAKNHRYVNVLTSTLQYEPLLKALESQSETSLEFRQRLMAEAFGHTADYDQVISKYFAGRFLPGDSSPFPAKMALELRRQDILRYGENSHQQAALYGTSNARPPSLVTARQLHGKQLSYNNILDGDSALQIVREFTQPACCVVKHNNPCGAAISATLHNACRNAFAGDPVSAFGSIVGLNRPLDLETARYFCEYRDSFVEAILAPDFDPPALELLRTGPKWKANVRLIAVGELSPSNDGLEIRSIDGGALVQTRDHADSNRQAWQTVAGQTPDKELLDELAFGWSMVRHVKSNAITVSSGLCLAGVGAGQMSRVDSVRIALEKAGTKARGAVMASDAFFPFPDSVELAAAAGIRAVIQPGGSVRDAEVIATANRLGLTMLFTGKRHFKH